MKVTIVENLVKVQTSITKKQHDLLAQAEGKVVQKDSKGNELFAMSYRSNKQGELSRYGVVFNSCEGEDGEMICSFLLDPKHTGIADVKDNFGLALINLSEAEKALSASATSITEKLDAIFTA
jgi:hypothetical protein